MASWREHLIDDDDAIREALTTSKRIAVLGIKPESRSHKPAFTVPQYLHAHGYEIVPVPVYYPDITHILGQQVYRSVSEVPGQIDLVDVFRRPEHIPQHVADLIAKKPTYVWFQLGIRNDEAAEQLARAGVQVVQDRCTVIEHRRLISSD